MRQLTSLDHQFLAMETAATDGHLSELAVYDPSTRPDGRLTGRTSAGSWASVSTCCRPSGGG